MTPAEDKLFEVAERIARVEAQVTGVNDGMKQLAAQNQQILSHLSELKERDIKREAHLDKHGTSLTALDVRLAEVEKTQDEHKDMLAQARGGKKAIAAAVSIGVGLYKLAEYAVVVLHSHIK